LFWREIAKGLTSEEAAIAVGASQAAGSRWFREHLLSVQEAGVATTG
jgi:hypothetical protein